MAISDYQDPTRKGGSIQTFSGNIIFPLDVREEDIFLVDIAHGLGNKARFTGHTRKLYSTAEHSVRVSWALEDMGYGPMIQFVGLHHDDTDAYLPDVPTPLKILPEFKWFKELEDDMQAKCFRRFGCEFEDYAPVKKADVIMLLTEKRELMPKKNGKWRLKFNEEPLPDSYKIRPWSPKMAKRMYLARHRELANALYQADQGFNRFAGITEETRPTVYSQVENSWGGFESLRCGYDHLQLRAARYLSGGRSSGVQG